MSRVFTAGNYFELPDASGLSLPIGPPGLTFFLWLKYDVTGDCELAPRILQVSRRWPSEDAIYSPYRVG